MASEFRTIQPLEYYRTFLERNTRPDNRGLWDIRSTTINLGSVGTADGSSLVKLGNTTVVCGIKVALSSPKAEEPNKGFIVPNVELPPLCSPRFKPGPPSEQAQVASQFILEIIQNSQCLTLEDLCIEPDKVVWVLYCDMVCLDHDGNLLDACLIALMGALYNVSLPKVTVDKETEEIKTDFSTRSSLKIRCVPVATTYAVFEEKHLFVDPTDEEEFFASSIFTIVTDEKDNLCSVYKPGGSAILFQWFQDCIQRAKTRAYDVQLLLKETVESFKLPVKQ